MCFIDQRLAKYNKMYFFFHLLGVIYIAPSFEIMFQLLNVYDDAIILAYS